MMSRLSHWSCRSERDTCGRRVRLFVSRACCGDDRVQNTSRLMWEVDTSGTLVHQVAIGFVNLDHTSLDVSSDGNWLLYLAGNTLYVSRAGATPKELTTGLAAADWE